MISTFPLGYPMALSATVTFTTANVGQTIRTPDVARLQVPYDAPFLLEEIRVQVSAPTSDSGFDAIHRQIFMSAQISGRELCSNYPVWMLGQVHDRYAEYPVVAASSYVDPDNVTSYSETTSKWRFQHPLFLRPGETIVPTFFLASPTGTNPFTALDPAEIDITCVGRLLPPETPYPASIAVPWATSVALTSGATPKREFTRELENTLNVPLYIQRFLLRATSSSGSPGREDSGQSGRLPEGGGAFDISILGPDGMKIIEVYPQATELFRDAKHAWNHGFWMDPQDRLHLKLISQGTGNYVLSDTFGVNVAFAMQGYREESL